MGAGAGGGMGGGYGLPQRSVYPRQQQPSYGNTKGGQEPSYGQSPFGSGSRYSAYQSQQYNTPFPSYYNPYSTPYEPRPQPMPYEPDSPRPHVYEPESPRPQPMPYEPETAGQPQNPFEGNKRYQAFVDYEKSLMPSKEQQAELSRLRRRFERSGDYKSYRIQELERQQQMQGQNRMMGGLGAYRSQYGPSMQRQFGGFAPYPERPTPMPYPRRSYDLPTWLDKFSSTNYIPTKDEFAVPDVLPYDGWVERDEPSRVDTPYEKKKKIVTGEDNPYGR